jgi:hypothetical protein
MILDWIFNILQGNELLVLRYKFPGIWQVVVFSKCRELPNYMFSKRRELPNYGVFSKRRELPNYIFFETSGITQLHGVFET